MNSAIIALVLAVIALTVFFYFMLKMLPGYSSVVDDIGLLVKKPICCSMLNCKPSGEQVTENPLGGPLCSILCWGVCG